MSAKTSQRRLAMAQRQHLKREGFPERDIQAFAELFKPADAPDHRITCADEETGR